MDDLLKQAAELHQQRLSVEKELKTLKQPLQIKRRQLLRKRRDIVCKIRRHDPAWKDPTEAPPTVKQQVHATEAKRLAETVKMLSSKK